jgi:hypothetical protein
MLHRSHSDNQVRSRPSNATGWIWLVVATLAFVNPLVCLIHCAEADRASDSLGRAGQNRSLMICQLAGAVASAPLNGDHGSASSQPKLPVSLLQSFFDLLPLTLMAGLLPMLLFALYQWRDTRTIVRATDAPPTPPPRLCAALLFQ